VKQALRIRRARLGPAAYYLIPISWGCFFVAIIGVLSACEFQLGALIHHKCFLLGAYWAAWCFSVFHAAMAAFFALNAILDTRENDRGPNYIRLTRLLLSEIGKLNSYRGNQRLLYWLICGLVLATIWLLVYWQCT
jgi:hypothetical protein